MNKVLSLEEKCSQDAVSMLYNNVIVGIASTALISFILFFTFYDNFEPQKVLWLLSIILVSLLRFIDAISFKKATLNDTVNYRYFHKRSSVFVTLTAFIWSFYFMFLCNHDDITEVLTSLIFIAGLASGGLTILSADKKSVLIFLSLLIYPLSFFLLFSDVFEIRIIGICAIAYSVVMLSLANRLSNFTKKAIRLKNENAFLVEDMEEQVNERTSEIHRLSNIDLLTNLSNRKYFLSEFEEKINYCDKNKQTVALLFIDLDGFKAINDNLGHDIGDQFLQEIGKRLLGLVDKPLICRWGGDEFLIALINYTETEVIKYAHQVINIINNPYVINNSCLSIGATVGIALFPEHSKDKDHLIELADHAMYFQKKKRKSSVYIYSDELNKKIIREQNLKSRLNKAIHNKELYLLFKKVKCIKTNKIAALEVTVSWKFNGEVISSEELFQIAEQYGYMQELEYWVLSSTCAIVGKFTSQKVSIPVKIKFCKASFISTDFIENIQRALTSFNTPAKLICIEVDESVLNLDKKLTVQRFKLLKELGVCLSVSNFGACLSSLAFLHQLGVHIIQIDKAGLETFDDNTLPVIKAMQAITDSLKYKLIVQGVKDEGEVELLNNIGIKLIQWDSINKEMNSSELFENLTEDNIQNNIFIG